MTIALILAGAYGGVLLAAIAWQVVAGTARVAVHLFARKPEQAAAPSVTPHVVVTLVHGTWARRADWTSESSPLCRTIRNALHEPVRFEQYLWSGWNTVSSRSKAVERLISHLADLQARWPEAPQYLAALKEASLSGLLDLSILQTDRYEEALRQGLSRLWAGEDPRAILDDVAAQWDQTTERVGVDKQKEAYLDWASKPNAYPN